MHKGEFAVTVSVAGRVDDVINVSGHRIGTAEVESALVGHPACAEAAVVPVDHPIKGQGIYAFITLMEVSHTSCPHTKRLGSDQALADAQSLSSLYISCVEHGLETLTFHMCDGTAHKRLGYWSSFLRADHPYVCIHFINFITVLALLPVERPEKSQSILFIVSVIDFAFP